MCFRRNCFFLTLTYRVAMESAGLFLNTEAYLNSNETYISVSLIIWHNKNAGILSTNWEHRCFRHDAYRPNQVAWQLVLLPCGFLRARFDTRPPGGS